MLIKALLFDLDGLILDTEKIYYECWKQAAESLGFHLSDDVVLSLRSCDSSIASKIVNEELEDISAYEIIRSKRKELMKAYWSNHSPELKSGVEEFLVEINKISSLKKIIVTQSRKEEKQSLLKSCGIYDYFDDIVSASDVNQGKPFPYIYTVACERIGVCPEECIAFEDAPNGVISASEAGVHVVMIPDLTEPDNELKSRCDYVFDNIMAAIPAIKENTLNNDN